MCHQLKASFYLLSLALALPACVSGLIGFSWAEIFRLCFFRWSLQFPTRVFGLVGILPEGCLFVVECPLVITSRTRVLASASRVLCSGFLWTPPIVGVQDVALRQSLLYLPAFHFCRRRRGLNTGLCYASMVLHLWLQTAIYSCIRIVGRSSLVCLTSVLQDNLILPVLHSYRLNFVPCHRGCVGNTVPAPLLCLTCLLAL